MESVGIKESLEALEALKVVAVAGKKIAADEKLSLAEDGPVALALLKDVSVIVAGVQDAKLMKAELKDLGEAELILLGKKALELIQAMKAG